MAKNLNSHNFEDMYKRLHINLDTLGCVMLDVDGREITKMPEFETLDWLYFAKNTKRFWIDGFVAGETPHVTLLYGFLKPADTLKEEIVEVLADWTFPPVKIKDVSFFPSPYEEEPYYCIIAEVDVTPELLEGHQRLEFIPHINTFPGFKAHITIAYIKKSDIIKKAVIDYYKKLLVGKELKIKALNFGGNEE